MNILYSYVSSAIVEVTDKEMFMLRSHYPIVFTGGKKHKFLDRKMVRDWTSSSVIYAMANNWEEIELPGSLTENIPKRWTLYTAGNLGPLSMFLKELKEANMLHDMRIQPTEQEK